MVLQERFNQFLFFLMHSLFLFPSHPISPSLSFFVYPFLIQLIAVSVLITETLKSSRKAVEYLKVDVLDKNSCTSATEQFATRNSGG